MAKYSVTKNKTHMLEGSPLDLIVDIVDKPIWDIINFTNCVNGTFYWYNQDGTTYPTSILIANGKIYQDKANHLWDFGCPQAVYIVYKDGAVDMKVIKNINELGSAEFIKEFIHVAIGGVGLVNKLDPSFKYDPAREGFKGKFADVLAKRNKTVLAYSKAEGKSYLLVRPSIFHKGRFIWEYDLLKLCKDCGFDIAISLDGGGSTFMDALWRYVFQGSNSRRINNTVRFGK
jgi:hypothetical protein